ncbi:MAG: hypothetical protein LAN84_14780 [Acidobacteriia bacterium]|nr:hypothetical protein [Terriglobia bacterium]
MTKITRRDFSRRAALAAALPLAAHCPPSPQETAPPPSRATELQKKADAERAQMLAALRAAPLPYDLEPAFVFAAKPREKKKQRGQRVDR